MYDTKVMNIRHSRGYLEKVPHSFLDNKQQMNGNKGYESFLDISIFNWMDVYSSTTQHQSFTTFDFIKLLISWFLV